MFGISITILSAPRCGASLYRLRHRTLVAAKLHPMANDTGKQQGSAHQDDEQNRREWIADEQWHIENATTDLTQFMRPLSRGEIIDDAAVFSLTGAQQQLSELWREGPALLVTGSLSCPPSRIFNPALNRVQEQYPELNIVVLYVIDAHPSGDCCPYTGTDWLTEDNREADIHVRQPTTQDQRNKLAQRYAQQLELQVPVVIDNMDNAAWNGLNRWPNMAALIGRDGGLLAYQEWLKPEALIAVLDDTLA
jgi:hypothetical protein